MNEINNISENLHELSINELQSISGGDFDMNNMYLWTLLAGPLGAAAYGAGYLLGKY